MPKKSVEIKRLPCMLLFLAAALFCLCGFRSEAQVPSAQQQPVAGAVNTADAHVGRGYELVADGRYGEAAVEFQEALAIEPGLVRARYQLAVCFFALQKSEDSREEFERVRKLVGDNPKVVYYLALLDLRDGRTDAAITSLSRLMSNPPFPDAAYYLGRACLEAHQLIPAERWLRAAAEADPHDYRVPYQLGRIYLLKGQKAEAEKQFEISSELQHRYDMAGSQAVACSQALSNRPLDEAKPICQQLSNPNDPDKLTTLGLLYGKHGYFADAVQPLLEASRLDKDSSEIQYDLGLTYFRLRRYTEARSSLEEAVALRPDFFSSNAILGATLYTLGDDEAAFKVLAHAHALNPEDDDTASLLFQEALLLANKMEAQNQEASALSFLHTAAQLRPDDAQIRVRISTLSHHLLSKPEPVQPETHLPR